MIGEMQTAIWANSNKGFKVELPTKTHHISIRALRNALARTVDVLCEDGQLFKTLKAAPHGPATLELQAQLYAAVKPLLDMGLTSDLHTNYANSVLPKTDGQEDFTRLRLEAMAGLLLSAVQSAAAYSNPFTVEILGRYLSDLTDLVWETRPPELGGTGYDIRKKRPLSLRIRLDLPKAKAGDPWARERMISYFDFLEYHPRRDEYAFESIDHKRRYPRIEIALAIFELGEAESTSTGRGAWLKDSAVQALLEASTQKREDEVNGRVKRRNIDLISVMTAFNKFKDIAPRLSPEHQGQVASAILEAMQEWRDDKEEFPLLMGNLMSVFLALDPKNIHPNLAAYFYGAFDATRSLDEFRDDVFIQINVERALALLRPVVFGAA